MILAPLGLILSFIGSLGIVAETISGGSIRSKVYYFSLIGVCESDLNHNLRRIKPNSKEIRVLLWIVLLGVGFLFQFSPYFLTFTQQLQNNKVFKKRERTAIQWMKRKRFLTELWNGSRIHII